jgi:hypothetical protein
MMSDRVRARMEHDFTAADLPGAIALLATMEIDLARWREITGTDNVEWAAVLYAEGDPARLRQAVELARRDWRDLLVAVRGG